MSDTPTRISLDDVVKVARLSRLTLSESEVETMADELNAIVLSMAALTEVDTTEIEPTAHAMVVAPRLRSDQVKPSLSPDEALDQAPERTGSAFVVPKVVG